MDVRLVIEHRWRTSQIAVNEIKSQTCDSQHTPVLTAIRCGTVGTPSRANGSAIAARNMGSPAGSTIPKASATVCRDICRANFDNHTWSIALLRNQRYNHIGQFVSSSMVQAESPNYGHDDMITKECSWPQLLSRNLGYRGRRARLASSPHSYQRQQGRVIIDVGSFSNSRIADWIPQAPGFHDVFRRCQSLRGTGRRHTYVLRR